MSEIDWINVSDGRTWGVPSSWASAGIVDARAFSIGDDRKTVHDIHSAKPNLVKAKCGVEAPVVEDDESELAYWRDSYHTCKGCLSA